ncbi:MAG: MalY/PatB family protein [Eggerthellaceae bacterium]|jgi:cystathionine beta-lyase
MHYDFDEIIDRRHTASMKYDGAALMGKPEDLLPAWVADMDFRMPPAAIEAVKERADQGIFGYGLLPDGYFEAVSDWFAQRYGWQPHRSWLVTTPGVVFALSLAIRVFTDPGDAILIQPPVYYPFKSIIEEAGGRRVCEAPLSFDGRGYSIDFDRFEETVARVRPALFLLCNPHNPVGRVWTREELRRLGDICLRYQVLVASDEIHADFARPGFTHTVYASLGPSFEDRCIICTAPSKTFNLAGLQVSNIFIPNEEMRRRYRDAYQALGLSQANTLGLVAAQACYEQGADWLDQLKDYLEENHRTFEGILEKEAPVLSVIPSESTYLAWVDCRGLGMSEDELRDAVEQRARLWVDFGSQFGREGKGFVRLNLACPRATVSEMATRLARIA